MSPCVTCPLREANFCAALMGSDRAMLHRDFVGQAHERAGPGQMICARGDPCADMFVLCQGWGFRLIRLSDGRRQILSTLLPGDLFSASMLFEDHFQSSVQALTEVRYCRMNREQIRARAAGDSRIWNAMAEVGAAESRRADELAVNLGRRSADERIAHLILSITKQLRQREVTRDQRYTFPLRQQHIADMTGLTAVHVSRVIKTFRKANLIELTAGFLRVLNQHELERIGRLR